MNKKSFSLQIKNIAWLSAGAIFFIIDRALKVLALDSGFYNKKIIGNLLSFNFVPNYNIAFSIPLSGISLNILIGLIILSLIIYIFRAKNLEKNALFLIICGATSNFADRLTYGYVIDYFDLRWFAVFNIADILIFIGTVLLAFSLFKKSHA